MPSSPSVAEPIWNLVEPDAPSPLIGAAIHDGHAVRPEILDRYALSEGDRLREEDPFTGRWTEVAATRVIGLRSRFEVDLNRPRDKAVYLRPEDAWGLHLYKEPPTPEMIETSLAQYDAFYEAMHRLFDRTARTYAHFVVLDLHTYNHRRGGPMAPAANPEENPGVNVGTGSMADREAWGALIDRFIRDLQAFDYDGRHLDVRENVKFLGGHFGHWLHGTWPQQACVLSVEFKKFFMDEWSGKPDLDQLSLISRALESTVPGLLEELNRLT